MVDDLCRVAAEDRSGHGGLIQQGLWTGK